MGVRLYDSNNENVNKMIKHTDSLEFSTFRSLSTTDDWNNTYKHNNITHHSYTKF